MELISTAVAVLAGLAVGLLLQLTTDLPVFVRMIAMFVVGALAQQATLRVLVSRRGGGGSNST